VRQLKAKSVAVEDDGPVEIGDGQVGFEKILKGNHRGKSWSNRNHALIRRGT
jgi:hypothetical protein